MSECPLCQATYSNDTSGDELFVLHLTNLHGMDDDNAQDILGRSMESTGMDDKGVGGSMFDDCGNCGNRWVPVGSDKCPECGSTDIHDYDSEADPFGKGNSFSSPNPAGYSDPSGEGYGRDGTYRTIGNFHSEWVEEQFKRDGSALYCKICGKIFPEQEFSIRGANDHLENDHNLMDPAFESKASERVVAEITKYQCNCGEIFDTIEDISDHEYFMSDSMGDRSHNTVNTIKTTEIIQESLRNPIEEYIESISNEVDFQTMEDAEKWWDNKFVQYGSKPWADQNIAERRTTINAYLRRSQNGWGNESKHDQEWTELMRSVEGKIIEHDVWDEDTNKLIDPSILEDDKKTEGFTDKIEAGFNKLGVRLDRDPDQVESDEAWKCDVCGKYLGSSDNATKHEQETGHYDMGFTADLSGDSKLDALDEAYGFSKQEWDRFSDDTKKSLAKQLGVDQPDIKLTEYSSGMDPTGKPLTYGSGDATPHLTHQLYNTDSGVYCKTCKQLIYGTGDESNALGNYKDKEIIDQMQSEESMCDSCLDKAFENLATEEDLDWITMKGSHIPIRDGQDKKSAVDDFLSDKGKSSAPKTEPKKEEPKKEEPKDWKSMSVRKQLATRNPDKWNTVRLTKGQQVKPISKQDTEKSFKKYPDGAYSWNRSSSKDKRETLTNYLSDIGWRDREIQSWEAGYDLAKVQFSELPTSMQKGWDDTYKKFVKEEIASGDGFVNSMSEYVADRDARNTSTLNDLYDTTGGQDNTVEPKTEEPKRVTSDMTEEQIDDVLGYNVKDVPRDIGTGMVKAPSSEDKRIVEDSFIDWKEDRRPDDAGNYYKWKNYAFKHNVSTNDSEWYWETTKQNRRFDEDEGTQDIW